MSLKLIPRVTAAFIVLALILSLIAVPAAMSGPMVRLRLKVTPQAAIAPAAISIMAFRTPDPGDRAWIVSLLRDGDDIADFTSEISVEGLDGDILKRITWEGIGEGQYQVLSCVRPALVCASARLVITAAP